MRVRPDDQSRLRWCLESSVVSIIGTVDSIRCWLIESKIRPLKYRHRKKNFFKNRNRIVSKINLAIKPTSNRKSIALIVYEHFFQPWNFHFTHANLGGLIQRWINCTSPNQVCFYELGTFWWMGIPGNSGSCWCRTKDCFRHESLPEQSFVEQSFVICQIVNEIDNEDSRPSKPNEQITWNACFSKTKSDLIRK